MRTRQRIYVHKHTNNTSMTQVLTFAASVIQTSSVALLITNCLAHLSLHYGCRLSGITYWHRCYCCGNVFRSNFHWFWNLQFIRFGICVVSWKIKVKVILLFYKDVKLKKKNKRKYIKSGLISMWVLKRFFHNYITNLHWHLQLFLQWNLQGQFACSNCVQTNGLHLKSLVIRIVKAGTTLLQA